LKDKFAGRESGMQKIQKF